MIIKRYPDLSAPIVMYGGKAIIRFSPSKWKYFLEKKDGTLEDLDGVTNTLKIAIDKSNALVPWAVRLALARARKLILERGLGPQETIELFISELDEILEDAKKENVNALETAGEIGHQAHAWIESLIAAIIAENAGREAELLAKLPVDEQASNCCIASVEWMVAHNVRWIATERKALSLKHKCCGTLDGLALVDSCGNPQCCREPFRDHLSLIDWKSSNGLYVQYLLQAAFYQAAYEEETGDEIIDRWVIRLGKDDGKFDPWYAGGRILFAEDFAGFLHALDLVRSLRSIQCRIDAVKDLAKEEESLRKAGMLKIACPASDEYRGTRKKKGCNGTENWCETCKKKFLDSHPDTVIG